MLGAFDMHSLTPNNPLDFDAAKIQRLSAAPGPTALPMTFPQLRQHMTLTLQSSLEVERILAIFYRDIQRLLPVGVLDYSHSGSGLRLSYGDHGRHSVGYNMTFEGEYLGELTIRRRQRFTDSEQLQIEALLACLLYPLRNALLYRAATQSALRDPLTGTGNRVAMDQAFQREVDMAKRHDMPFSLLMLDIDHFKQVNDNFGHCVGDQVLRNVADIIKAQLRNVDMVFRYGGEEFLILLSNTNGDAAALVGERLRCAVQELSILALGTHSLSASLGCATLNAAETTDALLHRADTALYVAKRTGRNRLAMAS